MKMKLKKSSKQYIRWGLCGVALFLGALSFLLGTPKALSLAESKIAAINQVPQPKEYLQKEDYKSRVVLRAVNLNNPPPLFTSSAVLVLDLTTGQTLYEKNAQRRLSPASTTKIMTALVSSEYFKPADILTVPQQALVGGSTMGLNAGEKLTFRGLLYGMLLNSGNDAAYTIAYNYPLGIKAFVDKMNAKVRELGLVNTHFQNPAGFDGSEHHSSALDLAKIASEAIKDPQLARIVATKETSVASWDKSKAHVLKNLNRLLSEKGVMGIKTGFTEKAGENFVGLVERDNKRILTVVLNSEDRFGETKDLIDWVFTNFTWQESYQ